MLSKNYRILFLIVAAVPLAGAIPLGVFGIAVVFLYYAPVTIFASSMIVLSFTKLSKSKLVAVSLVPSVMYTIWLAYTWYTGGIGGIN